MNSLQWHGASEGDDAIILRACILETKITNDSGIYFSVVNYFCLIPSTFFCLCLSSSDCLLSDSDSSASESPVADKRAPGSERAAERAAQQNSERIRLPPQSSFSNMQVVQPVLFHVLHSITRATVITAWVSVQEIDSTSGSKSEIFFSEPCCIGLNGAGYSSSSVSHAQGQLRLCVFILLESV